MDSTALPARQRARALAVAATAICCAAALTGCGVLARFRTHAAPVPGSHWSLTQLVRVGPALRVGVNIDSLALSCGAAGSCGVAVQYASSDFDTSAVVISETGGIWQQPQRVTTPATYSRRPEVTIGPVSCPAAGTCSAGGSYQDPGGETQAYVISEVHGTWQQAREVPGTAALNTGGDATTRSVSCSGPGTCAAGGSYTGRDGVQQAFVASEVNGHWQPAREVPGTAALNAGAAPGGNTGADVGFISCPSAGSCTAAGDYGARSGQQEPFAVSEASGVWGSAVQVPGTATLSRYGATLHALSCVSAGTCSAGGTYDTSAAAEGPQQAFVVTEVNGHWQRAREVPGTAALNTGGNADVDAVSCSSPGNCSAGGTFAEPDRSLPCFVHTCPGTPQPFVVSEVSGTWQQARQVPGTAGLNAGGDAAVTSLSCTSSGNCSAGGYYAQIGNRHQAFVVSEVHGRWLAAAQVPGIAALSNGTTTNGAPEAEVSSVWCAPRAGCLAGGYYTSTGRASQIFLAAPAP